MKVLENMTTEGSLWQQMVAHVTTNGTWGHEMVHGTTKFGLGVGHWTTKGDMRLRNGTKDYEMWNVIKKWNTGDRTTAYVLGPKEVSLSKPTEGPVPHVTHISRPTLHP